MLLKEKSQGMISQCIIYERKSEMQKVFGAKSQTLFLVRPDGYVAMMSEPVDEDAVMHYYSTCTN